MVSLMFTWIKKKTNKPTNTHTHTNKRAHRPRRTHRQFNEYWPKFDNKNVHKIVPSSAMDLISMRLLILYVHFFVCFVLIWKETVQFVSFVQFLENIFCVFKNLLFFKYLANFAFATIFFSQISIRHFVIPT